MILNSYVTVIGNLTSDPELQFTNSGTAYTRFSIALNERRMGPDGTRSDERTHFYNCVCWGTMAEHVVTSLHRGDRVIVQGGLEQSRWEQDGQNRSAHQIRVEEVGPSLRFATAAVARVPRDDVVPVVE